ncbi:MAG: MAPEG family protein [Pseudomonadota bacterium]
MTGLEAAGLYIGLNLLLLIYLALRVVGQRRKTRTSIGDGGHRGLALAIRVHGNAAEYVPAAIGGLLALALLDGPVWAVHALGGLLTVARLAHAVGFGAGIIVGRQLGTALTWVCLIVLGGALIYLAVT